MGIREEQKEQRKKEILNAGLELFVTKGYMETKISDIAKKVSMSTGLLFHYFPSKEMLYKELVQIGLEGTKYPLKSDYKTAIMYFEQFTEQLFFMMQAEPFIAKMFVLMAQAQRSEGTPKEIRDIAMQVNTIDLFIPIVEQGQKEGIIRHGDARTLSLAYWCSIQGIAENFSAHPEMELPKPEWIIDIVRGGKAL